MPPVWLITPPPRPPPQAWVISAPSSDPGSPWWCWWEDQEDLREDGLPPNDLFTYSTPSRPRPQWLGRPPGLLPWTAPATPPHPHPEECQVFGDWEAAGVSAPACDGCILNQVRSSLKYLLHLFLVIGSVSFLIRVTSRVKSRLDSVCRLTWHLSVQRCRRNAALGRHFHEWDLGQSGHCFFGSQVESLGYCHFFSLAPGHGGCEKVPLGTLRIASEAKSRRHREGAWKVLWPHPSPERIRTSPDLGLVQLCSCGLQWPGGWS